jgi:putative peptidoglycan lipid II flippase
VSDAKMMRSVGKMGIAVMISRFLGLLRDQVFAAFFGVSWLSDAFFMAFRIPNLLRDLLAEGALSTAFVTVLSRRKHEEGDESTWRLVRIVMTLQCLLLGFLVILGIVFAPALVGIIAPEFAREPAKFQLTITLTRILFPFILFLGMAALSMGVLNIHGRFGLPASASSFFNLGSIVVGLGLAWLLDPQFGTTAIICMAIGTVVGGVLQWLIMVPAIRALGYRYHFNLNWRDAGVKKIAKLMLPATLGVSAVQINVVVNSIFASGIPGAVAMLSLAFRLIQLPIGLFGVTISAASLPALAVDAGNKEAFRHRVEEALRLNAALCIPAAFGLGALAFPIIGLLFQHGRFDVTDTMRTADVLRAYSLGLVGYASIKVLSPCFYALGKPSIPVSVSVGSIAATIFLNWYFVTQAGFGAAGLALATSAVSLGSTVILLSFLTRMVGNLATRTWLALLKIMVASIAMAALLLGMSYILLKFGLPEGTFGNFIRVMLGVGLGAAVYLLLARAMGLDEAMQIERILKGKFLGKKA